MWTSGGFLGWMSWPLAAVPSSGRTCRQLSSPEEGSYGPCVCAHDGEEVTPWLRDYGCDSGEVTRAAVGVLGPFLPSPSQGSRFPKPALLGTASLSGQRCSPLVSMVTSLPGKDGEVLQDQLGSCGPLPHQLCGPGLSLARSSLITQFSAVIGVAQFRGPAARPPSLWHITNLMSGLDS